MVTRHPPLLSPIRGAASLIVVMVLFFIMALAGAYSSRNLIFEQRTSANQYRSTQAQEAAEAGVEWALAMLNGGRIGNDCRAGPGVTDPSFRQRYLQIADDGLITPVVNPAPPVPPLPTLPPTTLPDAAFEMRCIHDGLNWVCNCPDTGAASVAAPVGAGPFPAFQVRFSRHSPLAPHPAIINQPGVIMVEANGCTSATDECLRFVAGASQALEGRATVTAMVALKSALPSPPAAALTVRDDVAPNTLTLINADPERGGLTLQTGGVVNTTGMNLRTAPGTPGGGVVQNDSDLRLASPTSLQLGVRRRVADPPAAANTPNRVFASVFGAFPAPYRQQPAAVEIGNCAANCLVALRTAAAANPGRVLWVEGDLNLDSAGTIGSVAEPAVIVATGSLVASATGAKIVGFVYTQGGSWTGTGAPEIQGAAFVENSLTFVPAGTGGTIVFDRAVIDTIQFRSGSFVRVPGGWRDFQ